MGFKRSIVAGIVFALALGAVVWDGRVAARRESARLASARLLPMDKDAIGSVVIRHLSSELELRKADGAWRIARPIDDAADPDAVATLIERLDEQSRSGAQRANETELKSYGLWKPPLGATIASSDGRQKIDLLIGIDSPMAGQVYARLEGAGEFFAVAAALRDQLNLTLLDYRDRRLTRFDPAKANSLTLIHQGLAIEVAKKGDGWNLEKPISAPADKERVEEILRELHLTRSMDVITTESLELARYGLDAPAAVAIVGGESEGKPGAETFMVGFRRPGSEKTAYYAGRKGENRVLVVGQSLMDRLRPSVSDLRAKNVFTIGMEDVGSFAILWKDAWTTLTRDADGPWRFADAPEAKVDQAFAKTILQKLLRMNIAEYLKLQLIPEETGLDQPTVVAVVKDRAGKRAEGIETGRPVAARKLVYARKRADPEVFTIDLEKPGDFFLGRVEFLERTLFAYDPAKIVKATFVSRGRGVTVKQEGGQWMMAAEGDAKSYQVKETEALRIFAAGLGLKWEARLDDAEFAALVLEPLPQSFEFFDAEGKSALRLDIQGQDKRRVYSRSAEGAYYAVDKAGYAEFIRALNSLSKTKQ